MELEQEIWKDIPSYEGLYQASNLGNIRSLKRSGSKGLTLTLHKSKGYLQVWLSGNNIVHKFSAHRVIANTFIPNPENKPEVNHKDGNKTNNAVSNLEWCTKAENEAHKRDVLGHTGIGEKNSNFGHKKAKLYPSEELRNKLCALGVPRYKHNLAELGEMLPRIHFHNGRTYKLVCFKEIRNDKEEWRCMYECETNNSYHQQTANTEADARALLLIYLIENDLYKPTH